MSLAAASPNPFTDGGEIGFSLATEGPERRAVFDVAGRRAHELARGTLATGPHRARWDGCDGDGRRLGSGVYLVRLEGASAVQERKLVLLRS